MATSGPRIKAGGQAGQGPSVLLRMTFLRAALMITTSRLPHFPTSVIGRVRRDNESNLEIEDRRSEMPWQVTSEQWRVTGRRYTRKGRPGRLPLLDVLQGSSGVTSGKWRVTRDTTTAQPDEVCAGDATGL